MKMKLKRSSSCSFEVEQFQQRKPFKREQRSHSSNTRRRSSIASSFSTSQHVSNSPCKTFVSSRCDNRKTRYSIQSNIGAQSQKEYTIVEPLNSSKDYTYIECCTCHKTMILGNFRRHYTRHHQDPETWKFLCQICDERFPSNESLNYHLKSITHKQNVSYKSSSRSKFHIVAPTKNCSKASNKLKYCNQFESSLIDKKKRKVYELLNTKKKMKKERKKNSNSRMRTSLKKSHERTIDSTSSESNNQMINCPNCDHLVKKKSYTRHFMKFHIDEKFSNGYSRANIKSPKVIRRSKSSSSIKSHTKSIQSNKPMYHHEESHSESSFFNSSSLSTKSNKRSLLRLQDESSNCSIDNQDNLEVTKNTCDICLCYYKKLDLHKKSLNYQYGICDQNKSMQYKIKYALSSSRHFYSNDEQTDIKQKVEELIAWFQTEDDKHHKKNKASAHKTRTKCPHCDKTLDSYYLENHVTVKHSDPDTWKFGCHICDEVFPLRNYLRSHLVRNHKLKNDKKTLNCIKPKAMTNVVKRSLADNRHVANRKIPREILAECPQCGQFLRKHNLPKHIATIHRVELSTKSDQPSKNLSRAEFYRQSKEKNKSNNKCKSTIAPISSSIVKSSNGDANQGNVHNKSERVKCRQCNQVLRLDGLVRHTMVKHSDPRNWKFVCSICNKRYPIFEYLKNHMKSHVKEESSSDHGARIDRKAKGILIKTTSKPVKNVSQQVSSDSWTHLCDQCYQFFTTEEFLKQHIEIDHQKTSNNDTANKSINEDNPNVVELTLSSSDSEDELNEQLNETDSTLNCPKFTCSACPNNPAFDSSTDLIDHLQIFHVLIQSTPHCSSLPPDEMSSDTAFLQASSLNQVYNSPHANYFTSNHHSLSPIYYSTPYFNNNNQNNVHDSSTLVPFSTNDNSNQHLQPSQAPNSDLIINTSEPVMTGNDQIPLQCVNPIEVENHNHVNSLLM